MPIDPREIRKGRARLFELITTDRPCGKCRYNLKGLPSNGRCPECGTAITGGGRARRFSDNLGDAPLFYLKAMALGACLLAVFSIYSAYAFSFLEHNPTMRTAAFAGAGSLAWWVGVFILTSERPFSDNTLPDAVLDSVWLRRVNRTMQALWAVSVVAWVLHIRSGTPVTEVARFAAMGLEIVALLGLVPFAVHLAALADWAGDSAVGERFRIAAWLLAVCGIISEVGGLVTPPTSAGASVGGGLLWFGSLWATLGVSIVQILFLFSLFQLAHMAVWAIFNSSKAATVNRRLLEKRLAHEQEMSERTAAAAALNPPPSMPRPGRLPPKPRVP